MEFKGKKALSTKVYAFGAFVLWVILIALYTIFVFLIPHNSTFGPEIGRNATFIFFSVVFTVVYFFLAFLFGVAFFSTTSTSERDA